MKQSVVYIGIDVAKAHLDVAWAGEACRFSNERSGHAVLVRWLKTSQRPMQLICEASGGYEQALLESLEVSSVLRSGAFGNRKEESLCNPTAQSSPVGMTASSNKTPWL